MSRLIKKYKNRRLYDIEKSKYITIDKLQTYVMEGVNFRVEDSATRKDITNAVLLQIFVEMESGATKFFSKEILRQLIILAKHPMNQFFKEMLAETFIKLGATLPANFYQENYATVLEEWGNYIQDFYKPR